MKTNRKIYLIIIFIDRYSSVGGCPLQSVSVCAFALRELPLSARLWFATVN